MEGTYQENRSNFRPPRVEETSCRPLTSRFSPITPNGLREMSLKSLRDTPGWSIHTLEPVSTISRRHFPSISNVMEGAPCSNRTAILGFSTAFSWAPRLSELSPLSPLNRFLDLVFPLCFSVLSHFEASRWVSSEVSNARSDSPSHAS